MATTQTITGNVKTLGGTTDTGVVTISPAEYPQVVNGVVITTAPTTVNITAGVFSFTATKGTKIRVKAKDALGKTFLNYAFEVDNSDTNDISNYLPPNVNPTVGTENYVVSVNGRAGIVTLTGDDVSFTDITLNRVEPLAPPSATDTGVSGNLNGTYYYSITAYLADDSETEITGLYETITVTNSQVLLSLPVSNSVDVVGRRIYRTTGNPSENVLQYLVADIPDNTTLTYTDNIVDGNLGVPAPRINTTGGEIFISDIGRVMSMSGVSMAIGANALPNTTGYSNVALGPNSLYSNTTGFRNVGIGVFALTSNTTGARNTAIGTHSCNNNVIGVNNTAIGYASMFNNTGDNSVGIGAYALESAVGGGSNVGVGYRALHNTIGASNNTGVGTSAGDHITEGVLNTYIGSNSGFSNSTGSFNTLIGALAGYNAQGGQNTAIGADALYNNVSGVSNVAIGAFAGYRETGSYKFFIDFMDRGTEEAGREQAPIYGVFNGNPTLQEVHVHGTTYLGASEVNRTKFEADGTMVAEGSAVTWNDAFVDALGLRNGASAPSFTSFTNGIYGLAFSASATNEVHGTIELPHDYKEGTDIDFHVHWSPATTNNGNVIWGIEYTVASLSSIFPTSTIASAPASSSTGAVRYHQIAPIVTISGLNRRISDVICFRLFRDGSNVLDTFTGEAFLQRVAIHYQCDTLGSREEYTK